MDDHTLEVFCQIACQIDKSRQIARHWLNPRQDSKVVKVSAVAKRLTVVTTLHAQLEYYRSQHRTRGCELCHLFGVPLIAFSIPVALFNWRRALKLFSLGWALQFTGHYVFERNKPVLFSEARDPLTVLAALIYVANGWSKLLSGKPLVDELKYKLLLPEGTGR
jgi:hypothetical protein